MAFLAFRQGLSVIAVLMLSHRGGCAVPEGRCRYIFFMMKPLAQFIFILIFASGMKRLAYITAVILSLLVIYSGAGVSIVRYCCARCETVKSCCASGCPKCQKSHTCQSKKDCKKEGCTAAIFKPDLIKNTTELTVSAPVVDLFCEQFCYLLNAGYVEKPVEYVISSSPPPVCSRQILALYSTYLI